MTETAQPMPLDADRTALVVVDMQNAFLHGQGSCAQLGLDVDRLLPAVDGVRMLLGAARRSGLPVFHTRYVWRPDYSDGGIVTRYILPALAEAGSLAAGSRDAEIAEGLHPAEGEVVIDKNRPSAFYGTRLEELLKAKDIDGLIVCGVTTNVCVETTVRDAMQRDFRVWVVADATAEFEPDRHAHALKSMGWMFASIVDLKHALAAIPGLAGRN
ncbi:MAG: cysteine hydrolase [Xanthomonadales bacterium]|nr:cysteine hydrolase [Xanthomonadales bacterium]